MPRGDTRTTRSGDPRVAVPRTPIPTAVAGGALAGYYTAAEVDALLIGYATAIHVHSGADITSSTVGPAFLGTGTRDGTKFLRDDGTWQAAAGSGTIGGSGTAGKIPRFATGTTLGDSSLSDNGATLTTAHLVIGTGSRLRQGTGSVLSQIGVILTDSITAASGFARVLSLGGSLIASANGDTLSYMAYTPTFSIGAFTGVTTHGHYIGPVTGGATNYGLYIDNVSGGVSFALYTGTGPISLGGNLDLRGGVGVYQHGGVQVVSARKTGWTTAPTGTATRTTFATSTVTLPLLAERVKALLDDLRSHGLIGA